jgi:hypothetical protein
MTGKNSIAGHPEYKMKGRNLILSPFQSICNQAAKSAWNEQNRPDQLFVHSKMHDVIKSFKNNDEETLKINYETTLKGVELPKSKELVIHTSYDQVLNLSHEQLATIDNIFIDEVHTFSSSLGYRGDVIADLIYHLLDFIACKPNCKTKLIFMSGTPSLEYLVIKEMMKEYGIEPLYQEIKIDKKYHSKPKISLVHLDTNKDVERTEAVISQIKTYIKEGRKVCHIFNRKASMDNYIREIQTKLGDSIRIGLFYSGSTGQCTQNILSGKFEDYDVVLATTYFFNGLNINNDMLSESDIKQGKTSTQKYAVVIDLGKKHTRVNAIDAIQAMNRFRNRQSECTVFLPPIFKDDSKHPTRKFNYGAAGRITLGLNRYSYPVLSNVKNAKKYDLEEKENESSIYLRKEIRNNPDLVSMHAIDQLTTVEKNRKLILNKFEDKLKVYEDWFFSMDGYHYLAEDAGFLSIIKNKVVGEPLKKMTKDQIDLENKVVSNFINDEKVLIYLENHLDRDYRILVQASDTVKDPQSERVGNFITLEKKSEKFIIEGDFHYSHERMLNRLIINHLNLAYWYGADQATQVLRALINPNIVLLSNRSKSHIENINAYVKQCRACASSNNLRSKNFIRALVYLSSSNIGISKEETPLEISLTINNEKLSELLPEMWAKQQYDMIQYNLDNSINLEKKVLQEYYASTDQIKKQDIEELMNEMKYLCNYTPLKYDKSGNIKSYETFIIPKVMNSEKLYDLCAVEETSAIPELSSLSNNQKELDRFCEDVLDKLSVYINPNDVPIVPYLEYYNKVKNHLIKKEIQKCIDLVQTLKTDTINTNIMTDMLNRLNNDLYKIDNFLLAAFKTAEYKTHKEIKQLGFSPFIKDTFLCAEDFKLESLNKDLKLNVEGKSKSEIYDNIRVNDNTFIKSKRTNYDANTMKDSFIVLDKNSEIIFSSFSCSKSIAFLISYGINSKNEQFIMKDGTIPKREFNKGVYNRNTFRKDYYNNSTNNKTLKNYCIKTYPVHVKDYVDYVKPPKKKTSKK